MLDTMRRGRPVLAVAALLFATTAPALAADPIGEWLVEDGVSKIRIEKCSGKLWGLVSWEKESGMLDTNNPDPAKRTRPTLGTPLLLGMQQTQENRWDGEIYNPMNGKTYTANISLASLDKLRVQGCVLGFLCGGQTWTKAQPTPKPAASAKPGANRAAGGPTTTASVPGGSKAAAFDSAKDVCTAAAEATGLALVSEQPAAAAPKPPAPANRAAR